MGRELPLADFMARHAGIRSLRRRLRLFSRSGPAKQLWHSVSASAMVDRLCLSLLSVCPWTSKSVACVETVTLMLGCGGDRRSTRCLPWNPKSGGVVSPPAWSRWFPVWRSPAQYLANSTGRNGSACCMMSRLSRMPGIGPF